MVGLSGLEPASPGIQPGALTCKATDPFHDFSFLKYLLVMESTEYVARLPELPDKQPFQEDPWPAWMAIGGVEFHYDGSSRYMNMRPAGDPDSGRELSMSRGGFVKMIVLINDLEYDRADVNPQPLDLPMDLDAIHRTWIPGGDLEYSFNGVDMVNLRSKKDPCGPGKLDWPVYSFNLTALYKILSLFVPEPYAE